MPCTCGTWKEGKVNFYKVLLHKRSIILYYTTEWLFDRLLVSCFRRKKNLICFLHVSNRFHKVYFSLTLQLVDRVFDESLNFRKIPPLVHAKPPEGNGRPNGARPQLTDALDPPTITRRRTWSRDEVSTSQGCFYFYVCFKLLQLYPHLVF